MTAAAEKWFAVSVDVNPEHIEAVEFAFNNLDSLGSEVDLLSNRRAKLRTVTAYFAAAPDDKVLQEKLAYAAEIYGLSGEIDFAIRHSIIENRDWLAEWKKYWKPVEIGRFVIAAPWHEIDDAEKTVIRIEPNMAFGTGTHETTQLCLAAIDKIFQGTRTFSCTKEADKNAGVPVRSFLDVGTGTGILAIAAAKISASAEKIAALDTDAGAVAIARDNAELNGVVDRIQFSVGSVSVETGRFDFVCANLTADVIVPMLPSLLRIAGGTLILSGILAEHENLIVREVPNNLSYEITRAGEWIAITIKTDA